MHGLLKRPGYRLYEPDSPEARALLAEQGLGPADLDRALARLERAEGTTVRSIVGINEDGVFGTSRAGLAPGPARRLPRALHPAALAQGPRAARPGTRGQHGAVRPGWHPAGRSPGRRHRLPDGQLERRPKSVDRHRIYAAAASRRAAFSLPAPGAGVPGKWKHLVPVPKKGRRNEIATAHMLPPSMAGPKPFRVGFRCRPVQPGLSKENASD